MKLSYILHNIAFFLGFTKTYHKQALYRLFDVCNERYFEGKLPKIKIFSFLSFLSSQHFVSFIFIALFPTWHLALPLFSSLCMEFSNQEYWSTWSLPSLRDRPHPGIESMSPA